MLSSDSSATSQVPCSGWTWILTCATRLIPFPGATRTSTAPTSPQKCSPTACMIQAGENPSLISPALRRAGSHKVGRRELPGTEQPRVSSSAMPLKSHWFLVTQHFVHFLLLTCEADCEGRLDKTEDKFTEKNHLDILDGSY